jgi:cytochrome P450
MEAALALAIVLQRYGLTAEAAPAAPDATGITLRPAQPVAIVLTPR